MDLADLGILGFVALLILDIVGWWVTLFLWVIPTFSIGLGAVLSLSVWSIIAVILFFVIWMPLMVAGVILVFIMIFS